MRFFVSTQVSFFTFAKERLSTGNAPCKARYFLSFQIRRPEKKFPLPLILEGEKTLYHVHSQSLAKTPRAGNQRHTVHTFPPAADKVGFINIKTIVCEDGFEILHPNRDGSWHDRYLP